MDRSEAERRANELLARRFRCWAPLATCEIADALRAAYQRGRKEAAEECLHNAQQLADPVREAVKGMGNMENDGSWLAWTLDVWDGDSGLRLRRDAESGSLEFGLLYTRERAVHSELLDHCTHGDSSAHVDVTKLDPETEVYLFGGLAEPEVMRAWLKKALVLLEDKA